ncbi:abortive infection protein [Phytoactinopolyspora limicola]|uniref:abortive infection protein n=1 Tax=Phytoactinopolyspora limicola TaxID=2715536 RepID=UPI001407D232|nr:abortive infection protein [Phytoactinopolyspora limicola]
MNLNYRGVAYDTGTNNDHGDTLSREVWEPDLVSQELRAIREDLHCNAVGLYGTDLDRLAEAATMALEDGLNVWLQPRLVDANAQQTLDHIAKATRVAEELRCRYHNVTLNVGCELSIFAEGIIPGADYEQRSAKLASPRHWPLMPWYNRKLNTLLASAAKVARAGFDGAITYSAGMWERVNWERFDMVGLDYYRLPYNHATYATNLRKHHRHGKPIVITEFGCGSYRGAEEKGPSGHEIIDHDSPVPHITGGHVRDEQVQADQLAELLDIYEAEGVHGAFVFEFIEPSYPHSADARYDLDMAGYGLVKVLPRTAAQPYRWQPKKAFDTVATRYAQAAEASDTPPSE